MIGSFRTAKLPIIEYSVALQILPFAATRSETFSFIKQHQRFDCVIVGAGIHGATFARQAALNGLSTLLIEKFDYGSQTSSRSSKMAHGGLRYLEQFDFKQVYEGIQCREQLYQDAAHLVKPYPFLIPLHRTNKLQAIKLKIGLFLYELLRGRFKIPKVVTDLKALNLDQLFKTHQDLVALEFCDGLMSDTRLVCETILAARQEGAVCLNYTRFDHIKRQVNTEGELENTVFLTDTLTDKRYEVQSGILVNCAGPWISAARPGLATRLAFSQGSHLIFTKPWPYPALLLPLSEKGRYYFIWPHAAGCLVGTTERELKEPVFDPIPDRSEIEEILERLNRDLPDAGLNRSTLLYAYAGIRNLPLRNSMRGSKTVSKISRRHIWDYYQGVLTLLGGKLTSATWTVEQGLSQVLKLADVKENLVTLKGRKLPGAEAYKERAQRFIELAQKYGVKPYLVDRTLARLGARTSYFFESESAEQDQQRLFEPIGEYLLYGELELILKEEQVESLEDLLSRRLELEYMPGAGLDVAERLSLELKRYIPNLNVEQELIIYRRKVERIQSLLRN
jgi:glycerol-3-phosphate dehydrogenase